MLEVLNGAYAVLARPNKARNVIRVDGLRSFDVAAQIGEALGALRGQRPHLPALDREARVEGGLRPNHALTHYVAVGLVVVGGGSRTEKVSLDISTIRGESGLAFRHQ